MAAVDKGGLSVRRVVLGGVACCGAMALFLGACSAGTGGQAQPVPGGGPTTSSGVTAGNGTSAPKVAHPLDAAKVVANPCSALVPADMAGLGITNAATKPVTDAAGSQCTWHGDTGGGINIGWLTLNTNGLSDLYAKSAEIAYWQPTTVGGYPAAFGDSSTDRRAQGVCVISAGVSDHLYFDAQSVDPANTSRSCAEAQQAALDVIRNLRGSG